MEAIKNEFTGSYKDFQRYITKSNIKNNKIYTFYIIDEQKEHNAAQEQKKIWLKERFKNPEKSKVLTPESFDLIIKRAKKDFLTA